MNALDTNYFVSVIIYNQFIYSFEEDPNKRLMIALCHFLDDNFTLPKNVEQLFIAEEVQSWKAFSLLS